MEPQKKPKKSFSVPVMKSDVSLNVREEDDKTHPSQKQTAVIKKPEDKTKKIKNELPAKKKKEKKSKTEPAEIAENPAQNMTSSAQDGEEHKTTEKAIKKLKSDGVKKQAAPPKKPMKSLTEEEYDDIFMAVLRSVMKAESQGEEFDNEEAGAVKDDTVDTKNEVIYVTLKEESTEQDILENVEADDIDKWNIIPEGSAVEESEVKEANVVPSDDSSVAETTVSSVDIQIQRSQERKNSSVKEQPVTSIPPSQLPVTSIPPKRKEKKFKRPEKMRERKEGKRKEKKRSVSREKQVPKTEQKKSEKISLKEKLCERDLEDIGTWVQCCNSSCMKWRYLPDVSDPMQIPDKWTCSINTNDAYNSCSKPEEDYDESEHIYTKYTEGSVVLAKMAGYPWWPAMVEIDPDYDTFFEVASTDSMFPTKYHVVFFDKNVSRAWISVNAIKPFEEIDALPRKCKGHDYSREVNAALKLAEEALTHSLKERLKKYSFGARFSGKRGCLKKTSCKRFKTGKEKISDKKRQGSKRREIKTEQLDEEAFNEIVNSSQSVLSGVAEMLSTMESEDLNSDSDSEFQCENRKRTKRIKLEDSIKEEEYSDDHNNSSIMEEAAKFEVTKLDTDIFTMELDSIPVDVEVNEPDNVANIKDDKNVDKHETSKDTQDQEVPKTEVDPLAKVEKKKKRKKTSDIEVKSSMKTSLNDGTEEKEKPKKEGEKTSEEKVKTQKTEIKGEDTRSEETCQKMVKSDKGDAVNEIKKTKRQKTNTKRGCNERREEGTNCGPTESVEKPNDTTNNEVIDKDTNEQEKGEHKKSLEKGKKMKMSKKIKAEGGEVKSSDVDDTAGSRVCKEKKKTKDESEKSNKVKKTKGKFTNPLCKKDNEDSVGSPKLKSKKLSQSSTKERFCPNSQGSQKGQDVRGNRKSDRSRKVPSTTASPHNPCNDSDDDDFMLDLEDSVKDRSRQQVSIAEENLDEDSEPLDFEE